MSELVRPTCNISRTYKNSGVLTKEESEELPGIDVRQFPQGVNIAMVSVETKITKNLGNYETCALTVGVSFPTVLEEISECYDAAQAFVEKKIMQQVVVVDQYRASKK